MTIAKPSTTPPPINIHIHEALTDKQRAQLIRTITKENTAVQFKTPDITPAQIIAIVTAALATAVQFGIHISAAKQHIILADVGLAVGILFADGIIRHGRATGNANKGS